MNVSVNLIWQFWYPVDFLLIWIFGLIIEDKESGIIQVGSQNYKVSSKKSLGKIVDKHTSTVKKLKLQYMIVV